MWILAEYYLIFKLQILGLFDAKPPQKWKTGSKGNVILLQGVNGKWHEFEKIGNLLNSFGYRVHYINELGYNLMPLARGFQIVKNFIKLKGFKDCVLICHSKGCIIAKLLLNDSETSELIRQTILICSPNSGSIMAVFNPFAWELLPKTKYIKGFNLDSRQFKKITNLYPISDNHIVPTSSLYFKNVKNYQIPVYGHTLIMESKELLEKIADILI